MSEQKKRIFEGTLTEPYSHDKYVTFLKELLNNMQLVAPNREVKPWNTFSAAIDHYRHIGNYESKDNNKVALFSVCLKNDKNLENARSMQRNFVKTLLEISDCAGALVSFYTKEEPDKWRLSLVRMDYEFSKGKISEKLTPAKRYSYLVGTGEPCHTAQERLYPIFVVDDLDPSLNDLEEAFSVEAVTKDFFDQYRDKYTDLKEFLDSNPKFTAEAESRGFDSEQFAKKIMGQIVFLYFIQKKGWLGVNAFPAKMTEREYKAAFYRSGRKPKELMPYVYKKSPDGMFYRDTKALISLSPEDETFLSTLFKGDAWGSGPKHFMRQIFKGCVSAGMNFFDDYLEPLFYTGLNQNRGDNAFFPPLHRRIPFLNGGLFEEMDGYDWRNNDFSIPNELFSNVDEKGRDAFGILDVFERYNFTMAEDEPMEREVAIDPEMLGKVFENLLDVSDRKSKGAFYTPREIVHYMCQESLINYLASKTGIHEEDIRNFVLYGEYFRDEDTKKTLAIDNETGQVLHGDEIYTHKHHMEFDTAKNFEIPASILSYRNNVNRLQEIDDLLASVKVVDPAVGSGAFPLGMLNEIVKARNTITTYMTTDMNGYQRLSYRSLRNPYHMKRETIKNSIFACDIESSATDITKLRLWLSLVIDNQIMDQENDELGYTTKPRELPNLDCNIICGNSLIEAFQGIQLITESATLNNVSMNSQSTLFDPDIALLINKLIDLQLKLYGEKDHIEKESLKEQIQDIYDQIILKQLSGDERLTNSYYESMQESSLPFVLWQLYFPRVFRDNGGFDITIGNPPYIDSETMVNTGLTEERDYISAHYKYAKGNWDIYIAFFEKGISILSPSGNLMYITPDKWISKSFGDQLRIGQIEHISKVLVAGRKVFESALVDSIITQFSMQGSEVIDVYSMKTKNDPIEHVRTVNKSILASPYALDIIFSDSISLIEKMEMVKDKLGNHYPCENACSTSDCYTLKDILFSLDTKQNLNHNEHYRVINTGTIGRYVDRWGKRSMKYLKDKYEYPVATRTDFLTTFPNTYGAKAGKRKIIIKGLTLLDASIDVNGEVIPGKSTEIIVCDDESKLKLICAYLNSKVAIFYIKQKYSSSSYNGGINFTKDMINSLPWIELEDEEERYIVEIVEEIINQKTQSIDENEDISELDEKINCFYYTKFKFTENEIAIIQRA